MPLFTYESNTFEFDRATLTCLLPNRILGQRTPFKIVTTVLFIYTR